MTKVTVGGGSSVHLRGTIKPGLEDVIEGTNVTIDKTDPKNPIISSTGGGGSMVYPGSGIPLSTGSAWGTSITDNSSNWNTAYGWGDHASAGYLTSLTNGNGTTVNGTGDGVDLGGTQNGNVSINSSTYDFEVIGLGAKKLEATIPAVLSLSASFPTFAVNIKVDLDELLYIQIDNNLAGGVDVYFLGDLYGTDFGVWYTTHITGDAEFATGQYLSGFVSDYTPTAIAVRYPGYVVYYFIDGSWPFDDAYYELSESGVDAGLVIESNTYFDIATVDTYNSIQVDNSVGITLKGVEASSVDPHVLVIDQDGVLSSSTVPLSNGNGTVITGNTVNIGGTLIGNININGGGTRSIDFGGSNAGQGLSAFNVFSETGVMNFRSGLYSSGTYNDLQLYGVAYTSQIKATRSGVTTLIGVGQGAGPDYGISFKTGSTGSETTKFQMYPTGEFSFTLGSDLTGDMFYRNAGGFFTRLPAGTNGHVLTLAAGIPSWAAPSGGGGLTVGTSTITSGTNTKVLYNNSGVLGEYTVSGTGNVALTTSPVFTTPNIGTATGTASGNYSLASGGTATGKNTFAMGSNPFILTSGVTTGTGATAGIQNVFNSLTTGNGLDISTSSLTTGKGLALTSTSTAINHTIGTNALFSSRISGTNANSSRTAVAGEFIATNTGTTSSNIAIYAAASGGTTNYSFYASGQMYVEGLATSSYVAYFKAGGLNQGIYISSNGGGILPIQTSWTDLGNSSQRFKNAFFSGNVSTGGITTVLATLHSRGAGTTTGYNLLTENSGATARFGVRDNGAIEFSGSAGTSGYLLQSNGASSPPTWVVAPSGGSGITRSINSVSGTTSAGAAASTDYVYNCTSTFTLTLPTAVGNTNMYTIKNSGTGTITVDTTSSQTIDGGLTAVMSTQYASIDLVSNGTNWLLI